MESSDGEANDSNQDRQVRRVDGELGFEDEIEEPVVTADSKSKATRATLSQLLSDRIGISYEFSNELVVCFFDTIKQALIAGDTVKLQKFATFSSRDKKARPGRNPKTGEEVEVSARRVITFKPSRELRNLVDSRGDESK